jgi:CubicO group peptidase (beta-lactamase class C family)
MDKELFQIFLTIFLLASCSRQDIEPSVESSPSTESQLFASDIDDRIHQVENGLVLLDSAGQPQWGETTSLVERIDHYQVPGLSIAVIEDFEVDWAKGYGLLEVGGSDAIAPDSLFHAGSIAKTLSTAAALTLVEQGLLNLDENVNEKLVSWQVPENQYTSDEKVTLRRLLSHSAGLQDGFTNRSSSDPIPDYIAPAGEAPQVKLTQLLDAEQGVDVDGPTAVTMVPGTEYRYANADFAILELLITDTSESPFADFMAETLLEPLGMKSSTFHQPLPEALRGRATTEHDTAGRPFEGERGHFPLIAAGGLWTTPSDLARFVVEIMRAF